MTEVRNIYQRLAAVMADVTYVRKEKKAGMQYTIVSHDAVTAKVRPALLRHGIVYHPTRCEHSHNGNRAECAMTVRFVNIDNPADFFDVPTFGYGIDPQDKGPGKAMSYAVKYALLKALGLETGDDPDTDSIDHDPVDKEAEREASATAIAAKARADTDAMALIDALKTCETEAKLIRLWTAANHDARKPLLLRADVLKAKDEAKKRVTQPDPFMET